MHYLSNFSLFRRTHQESETVTTKKYIKDFYVTYYHIGKKKITMTNCQKKQNRDNVYFFDKLQDMYNISEKENCLFLSSIRDRLCKLENFNVLGKTLRGFHIIKNNQAYINW